MTRALKQSAVVLSCKETESLDPFDVLGGSEACRSCSLMYPPCRAAKAAIILCISLYQRIQGKAISLFFPQQGEMPPPGGRGEQGPLPPLVPPTLPFAPRHSLRSRGETGETGAPVPGVGSLLGRCGPEVSLRDLPRITVRGHGQGANAVAAKASLRSRVVPWGTKRPCGPLVLDARPKEVAS